MWVLKLPAKACTTHCCQASSHRGARKWCQRGKEKHCPLDALLGLTQLDIGISPAIHAQCRLQIRRLLSSGIWMSASSAVIEARGSQGHDVAMSMTLRTFNNNQQSAIARLFSAAVLRELAGKGRSPLFSRLLLESSLLENLKLTDPVSSAFDVAFNTLKKKANRTEYAYKTAITNKLLLGRHSLRTASLLTEFRVETCKVDVAIFNGTSTAYEIKSERDRLDRLENQLTSYRKVFSKIYVVTGENHAPDVLRQSSPDVGVLMLSDRFTISTVREATERPDLVCPGVIFDSLQLKEAVNLLAEFDIKAPNVPNTEIRRATRRIFESLDPIEVHSKMVDVIRHSRSSNSMSNFVSALPQSLVAAVFSATIKAKDQPRLLGAIKTEIGEALDWA